VSSSDLALIISAREIEVRLARRRILLEIDQELSEKIRKIARKKKQSYSRLINSWNREKIMQEA